MSVVLIVVGYLVVGVGVTGLIIAADDEMAYELRGMEIVPVFAWPLFVVGYLLVFLWVWTCAAIEWLAHRPSSPVGPHREPEQRER